MERSGSNEMEVMKFAHKCFLKILFAVHVLFIKQMAVGGGSISESLKGLLEVLSVQQITTL